MFRNIKVLLRHPQLQGESFLIHAKKRLKKRVGSPGPFLPEGFQPLFPLSLGVASSPQGRLEACQTGAGGDPCAGPRSGERPWGREGRSSSHCPASEGIGLPDTWARPLGSETDGPLIALQRSLFCRPHLCSSTLLCLLFSFCLWRDRSSA